VLRLSSGNLWPEYRGEEEIKLNRLYDADQKRIWYNGHKWYLSGFHCLPTLNDVRKWRGADRVIVKVRIPKGATIQYGRQSTYRSKVNIIVSSQVEFMEVIND